MRRSRSRVTVLPFVLALIPLAVQPASAQKVALRWKHQPGSELVYRVTNNQRMDMPAMGGSTVSEQIQTMRWRVIDVAPDGNATVSVTTERVQVDVQGPMTSMKYDSRTDSIPSDPQAGMLAAMAEMSYTMVVSPTGAVQSIQGLEGLREKILESFSAQGVPMMQGMFDQMFSEENMTRVMQQSIQLLPEEPVGRGDAWQSSFNMPVPMVGDATMSTDFTVADLIEREGRTVALVATEGELSITPGSGNQVPATFDLEGTKMSGEIQFDVDRGVTVASDMTMNMQMTVTAGAQEMSVGISQTTSLELVEYVSER